MLWLILTSILAYLIYLCFFKPMNYFKKRNIPYRKSTPIIGEFWSILRKKHSLNGLFQELYNAFPDKRLCGSFVFQVPLFMIRDVDLIKQITVKEFDSFINHSSGFTGEADPLLSKNILSLKGEQWRSMRATLSPSFTGSKIKIMFNLIADCADNFTKYFEKDYTNVIEVDMKDVSCRFANDVIATTAFGIKVDSLNDKNNEFFQYGQEVSKFSIWRFIALALNVFCPLLVKTFKISMFSANFSLFFQRVMKETIVAREQRGIVRPDMVQLLLESRREALSLERENTKNITKVYTEVEESVSTKGEEKKIILTDEDITAQGVIFFVGGFETVSSLVSFMSCELAVNADVQKKLHEEIDEVLKKLNGKVTYEALTGMKYLDMVVSESLRKWPPLPIIDRACNQDFTIESTSENEPTYIIEKGVALVIPVSAIHYDPKYFPNPDKFDPERFNEKNKSKIVPFSYMPFGAGPRVCIASRFALMEVKIMFFYLLSKFNIVPVEKTVIPLQLEKGFIMRPEGGFNLGFEKRFTD